MNNFVKKRETQLEIKVAGFYYPNISRKIYNWF